jgi:hypothetical protein
MKPIRKKTTSSPTLIKRLSELEGKAAQRGIHIHYDLLEASGIKLKGGMCKINGEFHIFIDRRKSTTDKIDMLLEYLNDTPS